MINIAINTFKEIIRNKFLYLIVIFGLLFIVGSILLGKLSIGEDSKIIVDFGIAMIEIFGFFGVLFVGSQLLFKEIEGKTIFLILSKPIKRYEFILGKFFGFSGVIFLITFLQSFLYILVLLFKGISLDSLIIFSLIFIFLKLVILLSIVIFLSTFMSNILTILTTVLVYFVSHSFSIILDLVVKLQSQFLIFTVKILNLLFPPFEAINFKDYIGSIIKLDISYIFLNFIHCFFYIFIVLLFSIIIFNNKKFE